MFVVRAQEGAIRVFAAVGAEKFILITINDGGRQLQNINELLLNHIRKNLT